MAAAFFGIPVGILTIVFVSQITAEPAARQIKLVEAIRQPAPSPIFDDRSV
jgi:Na+(H+)/acetate symporter ActP